MIVLSGTCCLPGCTCMLTASSSPPLSKSSTSTLAIHLTPQKMQHGSRGRGCVPSTRLTSTSTTRHCLGPNWISTHLNHSFCLNCNLCCEVRVNRNEKRVIISEGGMAGAWGAGSGPQLGASLTSSQYFPPPAPADEEGNLWADLLKGYLTFLDILFGKRVTFQRLFQIQTRTPHSEK